MDYSNFVTKDKWYGENVTTYKKSKKKKCTEIINNLYTELKVNDVMKWRLSIDVVEASALPFLKTYSKCRQFYGGWKERFMYKGSSEY